MAQDALERARALVALATGRGASKGEAEAAALALCKLVARGDVLLGILQNGRLRTVGGATVHAPRTANGNDVYVLQGPLLVVSESDEAYRFARLSLHTRSQGANEHVWIVKKYVRDVAWMTDDEARSFRVGESRIARTVSVDRAWAREQARREG